MTDHAAIQQQLDRWEEIVRDFVAEGPWQEWALRDLSGPRRDDEYAQLTIGAARVLALVAGLREVVAEHSWPQPPVRQYNPSTCPRCGVLMPCPTLAAVASVFAGEEDGHE